MDNSAFPWQLLKSEKDKKGGRAFEDIACMEKNKSDT